jgi:hypothetical protein
MDYSIVWVYTGNQAPTWISSRKQPFNNWNVGGIGHCKHWTNLLDSWGVREELFPKVKFVIGDYHLEIREPKSIAGAVRYHFPSLRNGTDEEFESFWFTYKSDINIITSEKGMQFQHQSERVSKVSSKWDVVLVVGFLFQTILIYKNRNGWGWKVSVPFPEYDFSVQDRTTRCW